MYRLARKGEIKLLTSFRLKNGFGSIFLVIYTSVTKLDFTQTLQTRMN